MIDRADKKAYNRADDKGNISGIGFPWNVCGDYLCYVKAMNANQGTGRPNKAVSEARLFAALAARNSRRAAIAEAPLDDALDSNEGSLEELSSCV